ncbi:MAG TPA: hypothetical protein VN622_14240 [Clostridia bacterium]|nr:hypothetical protein [Clostridia bacterium]
MTTQQRFAERVRDLIKQSRALTPQARKNVMELLDEARKRITSELVGMDPSRFSSAQLRAVKVSIDQAFSDFANVAVQDIGNMQATAAKLGAATVNKPMEAVFGPMPLGQVSKTTLSIAQGYTADLVTALSKTASANVNAAIQRAFLGGQPMSSIIEQVGRSLGNGKFDGIFGPIGERAQAIAVNEILRVHSMSAQARLEDLSQAHPDLQKQWLWIPAAKRPRFDHQQASGQVVDVNQPFEVGGEKLMFPRDPAGSAENTINCHCLERPYFSSDALKATSAQKGLLESLGIKVSVTPAA